MIIENFSKRHGKKMLVEFCFERLDVYQGKYGLTEVPTVRKLYDNNRKQLS